jgi:hypothetical protein
MKINEKKNTIEITKTFAQKASRVGSPEYFELLEVRHNFPKFKVVVNQTKNKDSFKGLTYEYMKKYIASHESEETVDSVMAELEEMILISKCHSMGYRYPTIKAWFLAKYPEIAAFGMPAKDEEESA